MLCAREFQSSISDSVHRLLCDQISALGLDHHYRITLNGIENLVTGSEFIFKGLRHAIREIKSLEGIDICWVEEAESTSDESWEILIPTIRKEGSEIWVSFNTRDETDPTYQRFVLHAPAGAIVEKVGWQDNPFFPETLNRERLALLADDPEAYGHIWDGHARTLSDAVIFRRRTLFQTFETPADARFFHGADWGFANDPTVLIRCWMADKALMVDMESFGYGVEIDETAQLFDRIPTARKWPIKADNSRPETISYIARQGFNIKAADKWPGSVEDGIAHLKGFQGIVIHERCKHMRDEANLYSYKVDKVTRDVLPIVVDKHNHGWDAIRYALDGYIQGKGRAMKISDEALAAVGR